MKSSYVLLPDDLHRSLKVLAADRGCTMAALFVEAVRELVGGTNPRPIEIDSASAPPAVEPVSS